MSSPNHPRASGVAGLVLLALAGGCDQGPHTTVILDNDYSPSAAKPLVVYQAYWQAVVFAYPVDPGQSSAPLPTVPALDNTAYVILAPGWDPDAGVAPTSLVVLESLSGFSVAFNDTLHIPVDDAHFAGNCAAGSQLLQSEADKITQLVFPCAFASFTYDATTCTVTPRAYDAGVACDTGLP